MYIFKKEIENSMATHFHNRKRHAPWTMQTKNQQRLPQTLPWPCCITFTRQALLSCTWAQNVIDCKKKTFSFGCIVLSLVSVSEIIAALIFSNAWHHWFPASLPFQYAAEWRSSGQHSQCHRNLQVIMTLFVSIICSCLRIGGLICSIHSHWVAFSYDKKTFIDLSSWQWYHTLFIGKTTVTLQHIEERWGSQ